MMSFGDAIRTFYSRYTDFEGRSRRAEYWWYQLYYFGIAVVLAVFAFGLGMDWSTEEFNLIGYIGILLLALFVLAHIIGGLALSVRRFHDLGQTGWLVLVFLIGGAIPLVGNLVSIGQLIWFALPGNQGSNKYGPDPLQGNQADIFS